MKTKSNEIFNIRQKNNTFFTLEKSKLAKDSKSAIDWLLEIGHFYGTMTRSDAIAIARVSKTLFERWERGTAKAPPSTLELLRLHAFGEPPSGLNMDWHGWKFQNGLLSNTGWDYHFTANDLQAVIWWQPFANKLACENAGLRSRLNEALAKLEHIARLETFKANPLRLVYSQT